MAWSSVAVRPIEIGSFPLAARSTIFWRFSAPGLAKTNFRCRETRLLMNLKNVGLMSITTPPRLTSASPLTWRKTTAAIEHDVETLIQISRYVLRVVQDRIGTDRLCVGESARTNASGNRRTQGFRDINSRLSHAAIGAVDEDPLPCSQMTLRNKREPSGHANDRQTGRIFVGQRGRFLDGQFLFKAPDVFRGVVPRTSSPPRKRVTPAPTLSTTPEKSEPIARGNSGHPAVPSSRKD